MIYKILRPEEWQAFMATGNFTGSPVDLADGYIHFSTADQVSGTARKHFSTHDIVVLVAVDPQLLGAELRYEPSRGGTLFPHFYGTLTRAHIVWSKIITRAAGGTHEFEGLLG